MPGDKVFETLSEIKERTARVETKVDGLAEDNKKLESVKDIAVKANDRASSAHKRVDKINKWMFAIGSTLITTIVIAVLGLIMTTN